MKTTVELNIAQIISESLTKTMSYEDYRVFVTQLAKEGKASGPNQTEALSNYTQLNDRRMKRWDKTLKIDADAMDKIASVDEKITFLVISESWCGDAAPSLPVMNRISEANPNIELKIVLRDENVALMNAFLTNGAMSIPKLIVLNSENKVIADWGPRPSTATKMVNDFKEKYGKLTPEFKEELQVWYNKDKGQTTLKDLLDLLPLK